MDIIINYYGETRGKIRYGSRGAKLSEIVSLAGTEEEQLNTKMTEMESVPSADAPKILVQKIEKRLKKSIGVVVSVLEQVLVELGEEENDNAQKNPGKQNASFFSKEEQGNVGQRLRDPLYL